MPIPTVAIVGRTNVGKSTLFNRVAESHKSLVSKIPGTTRDRNEADCFWRGKMARFVDTGGLELKQKDAFVEDIREQVSLAIKQADVIVFLVDAATGIMDDDRELAKEILSKGKPVVFVANKADNESLRARASDSGWKALGFGLPIAISAVQGVGVGDVLDVVWKGLRKAKRPPVAISEATPTRIIVIGKPNVGKSSLLNAILGEKRFITSPVAHTTREPNELIISLG